MFFTYCYTPPKSDLIPKFLTSVDDTPFIELLCQILGNHLDSFALLHLPHPNLLIPLFKLLSDCHFSPSSLPLLYFKATITFHLNYFNSILALNLLMLPSIILSTPIEELNYHQMQLFPNLKKIFQWLHITLKI